MYLVKLRSLVCSIVLTLQVDFSKKTNDGILDGVGGGEKKNGVFSLMRGGCLPCDRMFLSWDSSNILSGANRVLRS